MRHWSGGLANSCWLLPPGSTPAPEAIEAVKEAGAAARYRSVAVLRKRRLITSTLHKVCRRKGAHESGSRSGPQLGRKSVAGAGGSRRCSASSNREVCRKQILPANSNQRGREPELGPDSADSRMFHLPRSFRLGRKI